MMKRKQHLKYATEAERVIYSPQNPSMSTHRVSVGIITVTRIFSANESYFMICTILNYCWELNKVGNQIYFFFLINIISSFAL